MTAKMISYVTAVISRNVFSTLNSYSVTPEDIQFMLKYYKIRMLHSKVLKQYTLSY